MRSVILFIELLRSKPAVVFWTAARVQAALWWLVPALFYAAPPGDLAVVLAIGRHFQFGSEFGPPLAYWLAEIAFVIGRLTGVYLLSQVCVLVAYWAVFALGRDLVGPRHGAIAVLLMAGVFAFTMPTAEFGPRVLALPLWALALLYYWRAAGQRRRLYWLALGVDLALLQLTTSAGVVLIALLIAFTVATRHGRMELSSIVEPWAGGLIFMVMMFPWLIWLDLSGGIGWASFAGIGQNFHAWLW